MQQMIICPCGQWQLDWAVGFSVDQDEPLAPIQAVRAQYAELDAVETELREHVLTCEIGFTMAADLFGVPR